MEENKVKIGEVFSESGMLWKQNLKIILIIGFIVYLPAQFMIEIASYFLDKIFVIADIRSIKLMNNVYELIRYLIGAVAFLPIIIITYSRCNNNNEQFEVKDMLLFGLKRWPRYMAAGLVAGFKTLLYLLLLIVPGIYKGVRLSLVDCVVATKEQSSAEACDYSESLVENRWWLVAGFLLLVFILQLVLEAIVALLFWGVLESSFWVFVMGVCAKLVETYFIVVKGVFYFKIDKLIKVPELLLNTQPGENAVVVN
jgi:hypothetical protein